MFSILIAEDEEIERNAVYDLIKEKFPQISQIILAKNGQEAVESYLHFEPDIVLMDINMPLKDGITALKEIKSRNNKPLYSIILTSYSDFNYAQEAIRLHVDNYILKPSENRQIIEQITQGIEKLQSEKNYQIFVSSMIQRLNQITPILEERLMYAVINQESGKIINDILEEARIKCRSVVCLLLDKKNNDIYVGQMKQEINAKGYVCLSMPMHDYWIIYIFAPFVMNQDTIGNLFNDICKLIRNDIVFGSIETKKERFYFSFENARNKFSMKIEDQTRISIDEFVNEYIEKLLLFVTENQIAEILYELEIELMNYSKDDRKIAFNKIIAGLISYADLYHISHVEKVKSIDFNEDYQQIMFEMTEILIQILQPIKDYRLKNKSSVYRNAIKYICENYRRNIGLNDLARALNITPQYVSKVLSNEGEKRANSFVEILTLFRIEKAKRLLRKGEIVKDVAFHIGYHSVSYFSKSFKKNTGYTPKDYQDKYKQ